MSLFAVKGRVYRYEQLHDTSHAENLTMQSLTLTGAAMLAAALMTGCGSDSDPTAENTPGLTADAAEHYTAVHVSETFALDETYVNPCNGETVHLTGTLSGEDTFVGTSDYFLHHEVNAVISETGTGLTTGASYTSHSIYNERFNSPTLSAVDFTFGYRDAVHVNSSTPGLSFTLLNTLHFVQIPSGEFKLTQVIDSAECRG
jgi:hypothetical protein